MPIVRTSYPQVVFMNIAPCLDHLRNPIANALIDRIGASGGWAFQFPLYNGVAGMFYYCNPAFDMGKYDAEVPYAPKEARLFFPKFETLMKEHFGQDIMAKMLWDYVRENSEYFDYLFITDARDRSEEIRYVAKEIGRDRCAVLNIFYPQDATHKGYIGSGEMRTINGMLTTQDIASPAFEREMDDLANSVCPTGVPAAAALPEVHP